MGIVSSIDYERFPRQGRLGAIQLTDYDNPEGYLIVGEDPALLGAVRKAREADRWAGWADVI